MLKSFSPASSLALLDAASALAQAGLERPGPGGRGLIGGGHATRLPPERREIGMMLQSCALFPIRTVFESVAGGLKIRKVEEPASIFLAGLAGGSNKLAGVLAGSYPRLPGGALFPLSAVRRPEGGRVKLEMAGASMVPAETGAGLEIPPQSLTLFGEI
jgi:ABC-type sugar transport system ATPase subunit